MWQDCVKPGEPNGKDSAFSGVRESTHTLRMVKMNLVSPGWLLKKVGWEKLDEAI